MKSKLAIISGIFGGYDDIKKPRYIDELVKECDFIYFTDNDSLNCEFGRIIKVPKKSMDPQRNARYYKIIGYEKYTTSYDFVLWIDANYEIIAKSFLTLIESLKKFEVSTIVHSDRDCLYDEANWVITAKRDNSNKVIKQIQAFKKKGFPSHYGLAATCFLLRKNSSITKQFNKKWWLIVKKGSKRDQLSFDYCRWIFRDHVCFGFLNMSWRKNDFIIRQDHNLPYSSNNEFLLLDRLKLLFPKSLKRKVKLLYNKNFREYEMEKERLKLIPRYTQTEIDFLNKRITIPDIASFRFMKDEIFGKQIYKFSCESNNPYIIDCGANIGLSVIYFKQLFPEAIVTAFEPDSKIFNILKHNVNEVFELKDVKLIDKACSDKEGSISFYSEGADGGRFASNTDTKSIIEVRTIRLKNYLQQKVDFLKIDIEGAETDVILDCENELKNVDKIFVEYHSFIGKEQHLPEILRVLKNSSFRLHISSPGLTSSQPFIKLNTYGGMDNQLNIYGFRE